MTEPPQVSIYKFLEGLNLAQAKREPKLSKRIFFINTKV